MSFELFKFFWDHPPLCGKCGLKMVFVELDKFYRCYRCNEKAHRITAGADLRRINRLDKMIINEKERLQKYECK